jgi:uncharacterized protein
MAMILHFAFFSSSTRIKARNPVEKVGAPPGIMDDSMASRSSCLVAPTVIEALKNLPVVVITGMRQTGKTTFLQNQPGLRQRHYLTFDDFPQLAAAKSDPDRWVSSEKPLTIDEAHKCPEIFTATKREVDKRRRPGQFLLSGSANFTLPKKIRESLAGRSLYLEMHPFSPGRKSIPKFTD